MRSGTLLAGTAALVGDPARANILAALLDGRALTASELAFAAGVGAATASGHLAKLTAGGLLRMSKQGRHRYYALISADVARMLEGIMVVAGYAPTVPRATPRVPAALVGCRRCYDHMAGRVAVAIADNLVARGAVVIDGDAGALTEAGQALFHAMELSLPSARGRRPFCRPCLDWSERRPHLAGVLGRVILDHALERAWLRTARDTRALLVTAVGWEALKTIFGVEEAEHAAPAPQFHDLVPHPIGEAPR